MNSNPSIPPPNVAAAVLPLICHFSSINFPFVKFALSCPQRNVSLDPDVCVCSLPFHPS